MCLETTSILQCLHSTNPHAFVLLGPNCIAVLSGLQPKHTTPDIFKSVFGGGGGGRGRSLGGCCNLGGGTLLLLVASVFVQPAVCTVEIYSHSGKGKNPIGDLTAVTAKSS